MSYLRILQRATDALIVYVGSMINGAKPNLLIAKTNSNLVNGHFSTSISNWNMLLSKLTVGFR